jgi:superoxide reductase
MTKVLEFYKCDDCGTVVMVTHSGEGPVMSPGGKPMRLLEEKMQEEGLTEKHVPVIEKTANGIKVKVGSVPHPMIKEHYIQWISVKDGRNFFIHALRPGEPPEAEFPVSDPAVKSIIYCNVHNLWTNKK